MNIFTHGAKVTGNENREQDGIPSLHSMIQGLFHPVRLLDVIKNFICFPDKSQARSKNLLPISAVLCRPQTLLQHQASA